MARQTSLQKIKAKPIQTMPFRGGCNTAIEPVLLPSGGYSMVQNMRGRYPGMEQRAGCIKQHSTANSTNQVKSLYNFSKGRRAENHLLAQFGDNTVLDASNLPPAVTTGVFGTQVFAGSSNSIPASWTILNDQLIFANGVDYHQIWPGNSDIILKFVVYSSASALPSVPTTGSDYTEQVTDFDPTSYASLGTLGTNGTDCVCICVPFMPKQVTWTVGTGNSNTASMAGNYWKGSWSSLSISDNTSSGGKTLAQTGTTTFTQPTDALPSYMFGRYGYWLKFTFSAALSSPTITQCEYSSNWQQITNLWDGAPIDIVEVQLFINASSSYRIYGGAAITIGGMTSSDVLYFACSDPIEGFYFDVGAIPNTTASTTINTINYWNGTAWVSVGSFTDNTAGLSKSGWIIFPRCTAQPQEFNNSRYYAYWYKITVDKTLSANMVIGVQYIPVYDITQLGKSQSVCSWKARGVYSFDRWGDYLYITRQDDPQGLNGDDYGIIQTGDGRGNKVVAMRAFYNELLVWQEEKGEAGGCLTLIEGYSPTTYGKLLLSSRLGAMNNKCVVIVDGVTVSTATTETIKTLAFALSRYGIYATDGKSCWMIDADIRNYFDPTRDEGIRTGYESQMWLAYDSAYHVLRAGLVSGNSATVPNIFPVFDLADKTWSFDVLGQALSCQIDCGAGSGQDPVVQVGGGTADGTVYVLNSSLNDISTAISAYVQMEIDLKGLMVVLSEMIIRNKSQAAGNITLTLYVNSISKGTKILSMTPEIANQTIRRNRFHLNLIGYHLTLKFAHNTVSEGMLLEDLGVKLLPYMEQ